MDPIRRLRDWTDRHFPAFYTLLCALRLTRDWEIVHQSPPAGASLTPCCQQSPFDLPRYDRITVQQELVTCRGF